MKNQTIKLDCGHEVEVIAIDIRRTYGEFLAGAYSGGNCATYSGDTVPPIPVI